MSADPAPAPRFPAEMAGMTGAWFWRDGRPDHDRKGSRPLSRDDDDARFAFGIRFDTHPCRSCRGRPGSGGHTMQLLEPPLRETVRVGGVELVVGEGVTLGHMAINESIPLPVPLTGSRHDRRRSSARRSPCKDPYHPVKIRSPSREFVGVDSMSTRDGRPTRDLFPHSCGPHRETTGGLPYEFTVAVVAQASTGPDPLIG